MASPETWPGRWSAVSRTDTSQAVSATVRLAREPLAPASRRAGMIVMEPIP
jgi:hypothetical protein